MMSNTRRGILAMGYSVPIEQVITAYTNLGCVRPIPNHCRATKPGHLPRPGTRVEYRP